MKCYLVVKLQHSSEWVARKRISKKLKVPTWIRVFGRRLRLLIFTSPKITATETSQLSRKKPRLCQLPALQSEQYCVVAKKHQESTLWHKIPKKLQYEHCPSTCRWPLKNQRPRKNLAIQTGSLNSRTVVGTSIRGDQKVEEMIVTFPFYFSVVAVASREATGWLAIFSTSYLFIQKWKLLVVISAETSKQMLLLAKGCNMDE